MAKLCFMRLPAPPTPGYATPPASVTLGEGSTKPANILTDVALPAAGETDTNGAINQFVTGVWDKIKFTVTDTSPASSTITIDDGDGPDAYLSGTNYTIGAGITSLSIVVTTQQLGRTDAVRTFTVPVATFTTDVTDWNPTYDVVGDAVFGTAGVIAAGSLDVLTDASGQFTEAMVGKAVCVHGAGSTYGSLVTTVKTFTSATQVTLNASATGAVTGAEWVCGTDNRVKLQACLDAAEAGDTIYFPPGRYLISTNYAHGLNLPSNVTVLGAGDTSIIQKWDYGYSGTTGEDILETAGDTEVTLSHLKIMGTLKATANDTNVPSTTAVLITNESSHITVQHCTFDRVLNMVKTSKAADKTYGVQYLVIDDCTTLDGTQFGVYLSYSSHIQVTGCDMALDTAGCWVTGELWPHHFYLASYVSDMVVDDCVLSGCNYWSLSTRTGCSDVHYSNITWDDVGEGAYNYNCDNITYENITGTSTHYRNEGEVGQLAWFYAQLSGGITVKHVDITGDPDEDDYLVACASMDEGGITFEDVVMSSCAKLTNTPKGSHIYVNAPANPPVYLGAVSVDGDTLTIGAA